MMMDVNMYDSVIGTCIMGTCVMRICVVGASCLQLVRPLAGGPKA